MTTSCTDATIAALCCVYGDYVALGNIKTDDPLVCGTISGDVVITGVSLSETGPWGYDPITQTLILPNKVNRLTSNSVFGNSPDDTNELRMTEYDGTEWDLYVLANGTLSQKANSFEDNGVGIEIIHGDETNDIRPASPSLITNASGVANRKYRDHQYYLWFDDAYGKFTSWWDKVTQQWYPIRSNRNVLHVHPASSGTVPEYSTLSAALSYLAGLPVSPASGDPNQNARPSITNRWTVIIHGRITETATIYPPDFVDVLFMPGAQLYCTGASGPGVHVNNTGRYTSGVFNSMWSAVSAYGFAVHDIRSYQIVRVSTSAAGWTECLRISDIHRMVLSNIALRHESGSNSTNHFTILLEGNSTASTEKTGIRFFKVYSVMNASNNTTWPYWRSALYSIMNDGNFYADDCQFVITPNSTGFGVGAWFDQQTGGTVNNFAAIHLNECFFNAARGSGCHAIVVSMGISNGSPLGMVDAVNCTFEAYGDSSGYGCAAANVETNFKATKCIFRIASWTTTGASPNALTANMAASSCAIYAPIANNAVMSLDECMLYGETPAATALSIVNNGSFIPDKIVMTGCILNGQLASVASLSGTESLNKKFYRSQFVGPIVGTPFGCAAATTTYNTSFLI